MRREEPFVTADCPSTDEPPVGRTRLPPAARAKHWLFRIMAISTGCAAALILTEITLRALDVQPAFNIVFAGNYRLSDNPTLEYELVPGSPDRKHVISSTGLRDREFAVPPPPHTFRIAVVGDSVTYGLACWRDETYPKRLEQYLNRYAAQDAPQFEVLNMGVVGYNAHHVAEQVRVKALPFQPDLIIYGYVLNDGQQYSFEAASLRKLRDEVRFGRHGTTTRRLLEIFRRSRLVTLARQWTIRPWQYLHVLPQEPAYNALEEGRHLDYLRNIHTGRAWQRVTASLGKIANLTAGGTAPPVVLAIFPIDAACFGPYPLQPLHEKIRAAAKQRGLATADLTPAFTAAQPAFRQSLFDDFLHPSPTGHRVTAAAILLNLLNLDLLPADTIGLPPDLGTDTTDAIIELAREAISPDA